MSTVRLTFVARRNAISDGLAYTHAHSEKQWTCCSAVHQPGVTDDMAISVTGPEQLHSKSPQTHKHTDPHTCTQTLRVAAW